MKSEHQQPSNQILERSADLSMFFVIYIYTYVYIIYQYIFEQLLAATVLLVL